MTNELPELVPAATGRRFSVVIPVYESADIVGDTVRDVLDVFDAAALEGELVLVNDGSRDRSWDVISEWAEKDHRVVAVDLLRNYGQHYANLAGLRVATGDYVITMDDDGQNPADQIPVLVNAALTGDHDVVFGKFERKQAAGYRRLGTRAIDAINRRVFGQPPGLAVSNFRVLRRDVVDRICGTRTAYPYITGQALMFSSNRGNVVVRHEPRRGGTSHYGLMKITRLVLTILFSYSVFPLRLAATVGYLVAGISFLIGVVYLVRGLLTDIDVPGWTTLVVMLAVLNGVIIALLAMLGEYVVRTLNTVSVQNAYHVTEIRDHRRDD